MLHLEFTRNHVSDNPVQKTLRLAVGTAQVLEINRDCLDFDGEINQPTYSIADIQDIGHLMATTFKNADGLALHIDDDVAHRFTTEVWVQWLSFGLALSRYKYHHTPSALLQPVVAQFQLKSVDSAASHSELPLLRDAFTRGQILAHSQLIARELMNKPGNVLYPETFVHAVEALAINGVSLSYLSDEAMLEQGFGGLMGIAQGSDREARLLCLDYCPANAQTTITLVGKGVTFDSGGISIKQPRYMSTMKVDMSGAAAVVGAVNAIATLKLPIRVIGLCGLVENMPSGKAVKPGDVVTMLSNTSVEIITTDAEGRMVLADVLHYAQQTYQPDYLIDIATLTGGTGIALGKAYASLMGNDPSLMTIAQQAGTDCAEAVWPMPSDNAMFKSALKSDFAELRHGSEEPDGSPCVAATFLQHFVAPEQKWIHIDSAAMSLGMNHRHIHHHAASGFGALLLTQICQQIADQASMSHQKMTHNE
ncbi:M17 family metallopeptidase [Photobacterium nomapromontoriensis]|uniref:M17 family metallopeptidase n=1 Tax=Photobacterium nomapromontoriensis TaxID=2910237 RepID=UPI003D096F5C